MTHPMVSVLMPVYNQAIYVGAAIESILSQTFSDFELIVADDGSTDGTFDQIRSFRDDRITVLALPHRGCVPTLVEAARRAQGKFMTRQDADDLSHPERLRLQVGFLESHPGYGLVGGDYRLIDREGVPFLTMRTLLGDRSIRETFVVELPFCGPLVMVRRAAAELAGGFVDPHLTAFEDPDLCWRMTRRYRVANIPEIVYDYRRHPGNVSIQGWHKSVVRDRWKGIRSELDGSGDLEMPSPPDNPPAEPEDFSDPHQAQRQERYVALRYEVGFFYLELGQALRGRNLMCWACRQKGGNIPVGRRATLVLSRFSPFLAVRLRRWIDARRQKIF